MARVHIIIAGHLVMSPRGRREACLLRAAGHEVTVSGVWFDETMASLDREWMRRNRLRFSPALDIRPRGVGRRLAARVRSRWARTLFNLNGAFSPHLLGYGVHEQLTEARAVAADLTIVHGESGLWIAGELLKEDRAVGVDFEDWFSRDLLPEDRRTRPVRELARLEGEILHRAIYRVASSRGIARGLADAHGAPEPVVVTNAGQEVARPARVKAEGEPLLLHWFSQTLGPGRGLEFLLEALPLVRHPVHLMLRGACPPARRKWLDRLLAGISAGRVTLSPASPPWRLAARVAEHHVGLALETPEIPNRDLCVTNKFFQYLASGLAVIATPTHGQREALGRCPEAGILLPESTPASLADAIDGYAAAPQRLANARRAALAAATDGPWCGVFENEAIVGEAHRALGKGPLWRRKIGAERTSRPGH